MLLPPNAWMKEAQLAKQRRMNGPTGRYEGSGFRTATGLLNVSSITETDAAGAMAIEKATVTDCAFASPSSSARQQAGRPA